ncbi:hypothetical protein BW247_15865 [Acidihalobacter ferrooxydans]|uniref:Uncharacterized protein n=1 Tax=Acidihalobacter ferrooxydans TaxID=1765967 RepID=A0A1P8UKR8_9GAMM|nr:hypothetical protein BW247_15865 [Acidihalobacter ferrooxydans]
MPNGYPGRRKLTDWRYYSHVAGGIALFFPRWDRFFPDRTGAQNNPGTRHENSTLRPPVISRLLGLRAASKSQLAYGDAERLQRQQAYRRNRYRDQSVTQCAGKVRGSARYHNGQPARCRQVQEQGETEQFGFCASWPA